MTLQINKGKKFLVIFIMPCKVNDAIFRHTKKTIRKIQYHLCAVRKMIGLEDIGPSDICSRNLNHLNAEFEVFKCKYIVSS